MIKHIKKTHFLIISLLLLLILFVGFFVWIANQKSDISNIPKSMNVSSMNVFTDNKYCEEKLKWYDTIDEAKSDVSIIKGNDSFGAYRLHSNEFLQKKYENRLILFYLITEETSNSVNPDAEAFAYMIFKIKNNQISQPYWIESYNLDVGFIESHYTYDFDDSVAEFITYESVLDVLADNENGFPIYFGTWSNAEATTLKIDNIKAEVIPITLEDKTYYFWYFIETDWSKRLSTIDWNKYTYQQIIKLMKIEYEQE